MIDETTAKLASDSEANTETPDEKRSSPTVQSKTRRSLVALRNRAPLLLFAIALMLAAFAGGVYVHSQKVFPYDLLRSAYKTGKTLFATWGPPSPPELGNSVDISPDSVEARRFEFIGADTLADPILVLGGAEQFAEYCPDARGCLAVEYAGRGEVRHAYPYRPDEFENGPIIVSLPHEQPFGIPFFHYAYAYPFGISRYSNGDLLIVFHFQHSFPYSGGVARIDRDGRVIWYRRDYSHHRPYMTDGDIALVPSMRIGEGSIEIKLSNKARTVRTLDCQDGKFYRDFVHIIDGKGRLLKEISILDALLESPYARMLYSKSNSCDLTHLNFVHQLREDAGGAKGIAPGDLVVSLRNLNAFGILDRKSHRLKKLVRGEFFRQHSVTHLEGAKFLMFDNWGSDGIHGPSRLLMVDLANGEETTIFPNDRTPEHLRDMFSVNEGHISVSPDRRRCIISFDRKGKAVEVRLADGAVLSAFTNLHDMSHLNALPDERKTKAGRYWLRAITYIDKKGRSR